MQDNTSDAVRELSELNAAAFALTEQKYAAQNALARATASLSTTRVALASAEAKRRQADIPPSTATAIGPPAQATRVALDQLSKPYSWGATGPSSFDCSGLIYYLEK